MATTRATPAPMVGRARIKRMLRRLVEGFLAAWDRPTVLPR